MSDGFNKFLCYFDGNLSFGFLNVCSGLGQVWLGLSQHLASFVKILERNKKKINNPIEIVATIDRTAKFGFENVDLNMIRNDV